MLRIAIADDHTLFRKSLVLLLDNFPNMKVVLEAENGQELIDRLAREQIDILLLDLQMPAMNGFEAAGVIKKLFPHIKILVLTHMNEADTIRRVIQMGVHGFFTKTTPPTELESAIWKLRYDGFYFEKSFSSVITAMLNNSQHLDDHPEIPFTERELDIIKLTAQGLKAKDIAAALFISAKTVNAHKQNIQQKYGFDSMMDAILYCIYHKVIDIELIASKYS